MSASTTRFRPGTHQRGEETRGRILAASIELFADQGFEGATTRAIAERAGVNLPAIQYYFGSKEGLYRAVIEQFAEHLRAGVGPIAERIRAALADPDAARRVLLDLLCDMIAVVIGLILDDSQPDRECRQKFFARLEVEPNQAFEALQDEMIRHVSQPCCEVISRLTGMPANDERVLLEAMTLIGQAKIFCGWGTARCLGWTTMSEDRVRAAQAVVRRNIVAIFSGDAGVSA